MRGLLVASIIFLVMLVWTHAHVTQFWAGWFIAIVVAAVTEVISWGSDQ